MHVPHTSYIFWNVFCKCVLVTSGVMFHHMFNWTDVSSSRRGKATLRCILDLLAVSSLCGWKIRSDPSAYAHKMKKSWRMKTSITWTWINLHTMYTIDITGFTVDHFFFLQLTVLMTKRNSVQLGTIISCGLYMHS